MVAYHLPGPDPLLPPTYPVIPSKARVSRSFFFYRREFSPQGVVPGVNRPISSYRGSRELFLISGVYQR